MNELEELRKENEKLKEEIKILKERVNSQKEGMRNRAKGGKSVSRPPFGYNLKEGVLVPNENRLTVENIFLDFQNNELSLNKLAKKYGFTVNGIKKILKNFTYIGKIKFEGVAYEASHEPIISTTVFNHVQDKLERRGIK